MSILKNLAHNLAIPYSCLENPWEPAWGAGVAAAGAVQPIACLVMVTHFLRFDLRDFPMAALFAVTGVTAFYGTCPEDRILMMLKLFRWSEHLKSC